MNILDINDLPTITMQISGREGTASGAWVINQEKKEKIEISAGDVNYSAGSELVIVLNDANFIQSIESNTTLSIVVFNGSIPLYRDIVKFRGQLDSVNFYSQYDHSADYYVYGDADETEGEGDGTVGGGGDTGGGGYTPPTYTGSLVVSDFAIKFDIDNNGQGEMRSDGISKYVETLKNTLGDFKVRTLQYGEFEDTPVALEEVVVHSFGFDVNNGNSSGYHPTFLANTPELEGTYYHFAGGQSQQASELLMELIQKEELLEDTTGNASVFIETSLSDWTVGMSIYKDISGTPIMDGRTSSWDRYHFITKNTAGEWTLIRSTDNIVTHVEVVKDTDYLKFVEMYPVSVVTSPYDAKPRDFAAYLVWFDDKINDPNSIINWSDSRSSEDTLKRYVFDYSNSELIAIGDDVLKRTVGRSSQVQFHSNIGGIETNPDLAGSAYQYQTQQLTTDGVNYLLIQMDLATGKFTNHEWYTVT